MWSVREFLDMIFVHPCPHCQHRTNKTGAAIHAAGRYTCKSCKRRVRITQEEKVRLFQEQASRRPDQWSDSTVITGLEIESARKLLGWTPSALSRRAGSMMTARAISRAENGHDGALSTEQLLAIEQVLTDAGIEFRRNRLPVLRRQAIGPPKLVRLWVCAGTEPLLDQELLRLLLWA
jgi:transcriptional regulator with XRE-family HTH domain